MTLAQHLAALELLRARAFPEEGYHLAELAVEEPTEEQAEAEREALALLLGSRWGPPRLVSLYSLLARAGGGEEIPAPWGLLCASVPDIQLWRVDARWVALAHARLGEDGHGLLACVTEVDPP
ncbi:hypothetical protein M5362_10980 [Streptomyces sp. Je 1-79]|uniref:hypothetical protein n=1 Tax=Streptomyces sp. Je 1-79 TaxID=2943847 RepID=UPI0021A56C03|nr:hypothetical protein [Streptomyces sp. Je 1-79]MCT4353651.1 hypothetical protein [Streptomyces sp. Je 1-79]